VINLFVYIEYVECTGKILFAFDHATLEKVSKRYRLMQPKSLTSQFPDRFRKKDAIEKQKKRKSLDKVALHPPGV
jgi:type IV secretory pathway VirD2 relaxase